MRFCARCCAPAPTNWSTARTCRAASWCPNMSTSRTPLSRRRRPAWSTRCWTRSPASSAAKSFRVASAPTSGEDSLIARYFTPIATDPGALGLNDDAAILKARGEDIVVTTDAVVEGVHFLPDDPADTIARKALRVNLSDLAAKGAAPAGFVLTLALRKADEAWLKPFAEALGEDTVQFGCPLLGGDTVSTPGPLMISITAFGRVPAGKMVHRSGAKPGDRVVVTGTIGDAALGLDILRGGAGAAMDVSDGLAGDLAKLCAASGVSAVIDAPSIPLSAAAAALLAGGSVGIEAIVAGGDDYEVLCAVPENRLAAFAQAADAARVALTSIGAGVTGVLAPKFLDAQGSEIGLKR